MSAIEVDGKDVRVIKKARACKDGVQMSFADGTWAYGYQIAARQSADAIDTLRKTNTLG